MQQRSWANILVHEFVFLSFMAGLFAKLQFTHLESEQGSSILQFLSKFQKTLPG